MADKATTDCKKLFDDIWKSKRISRANLLAWVSMGLQLKKPIKNITDLTDKQTKQAMDLLQTFNG